MASRSMKALSQRALEELVARSTKAISPILLPFEPDDEDPDGYNMVVVFPVMLRAGGFMLAVPLVPAAQAAIEAIDCGTEGVEPAFHRGALQLETARGRRLGSVDALLADLPWTAISAFSPSGAMKGLPPGEAKAIQFSHEDVLGRPTKQSAEDLATAWISSTLDEETAQEYLTGEEVPELEVVEDPVPRAQEDSGISADVVQALQQRIMELERQVQPTAPPATKVGASPKAPALLNIPASAPNNIDWNRLHQLAGSPPPRIGKPDTNRPVPQKSQALDHVLADVEKEADEIQTGEEGLDLLAQGRCSLQGDGDPTSTESVVAPEASGASIPRPCYGGSGGRQRLGQRKRQQWRQRMPSARSVHPSDGRLAAGCCSDSGKRCEGAGADGGQDRRQPHEEVRGASHPDRRQQDGWLPGLHDGRGLDDWMGVRECADAGDGEQGALLPRADQFGCREDAVELAADGNGRTALQPLLEQQASSRATTVLPSLSSFMGGSKPQLRSGFGHPRIQDVDHGKASQGPHPERRPRAGGEPPAEAPAKEPQRQREEECRAGRRFCHINQRVKREPSMSQGSVAESCSSDETSVFDNPDFKHAPDDFCDRALPHFSDPSQL